MDPGKSLIVSFENSVGSKSSAQDDQEDSLTKEISLDYSEDEEMRSASASPKGVEIQEVHASGQDFAPVDDVDVFTVDEEHFDTSGGEIRRKTKIERTLDVEKLGGPPNVKRYMNPKLQKPNGFEAYLESDEQKARRAERAKRFGLDTHVSETPSSDVPMINEPTSELLNKLYEFYNIDPENSRHKSRFRLNAIYLRGVSNLSTEDIFDYFGPYNPSYLEWIDDSSCNVVWSDRTAAARALLGMSKPLRRIWPATSRREDKDKDEKSDKEEFQSPLKRKLSNDAVPLRSATPEERRKEENVDRILEDEEPIEVDVSQLTIPPGSWRVGNEIKTSQTILFRFSTVDDVKGRDAQRKSHYYREHGNPNFGGRTGLISRSYMDRVSRKRRRSFDHDEPAPSKSMITSDLRKTITDRSRWSLLRDDLRRDPELEPGELVEQEDTETGEVKLTYFSSDDEDMGDAEDRRSKKPRMRMRADEEENRKQQKRRQLQRIKTSRQRSDGIDGDWRSAQTASRDLRGRLDDARMKITVPNERASTRDDLRHRLGRRRSRDRYRDGSPNDDDRW